MAGVSQERDTPLCPLRQRIAIEQRPLERLIDRGEDRRHLRMPSLVVPYRVGDGPAIRPLFACPGGLFADRDKVQKSARGNVIMDKMSARSHPVCDIEREAEMRDALRRRKPSIR